MKIMKIQRTQRRRGVFVRYLIVRVLRMAFGQ